MPRAGGTRSQPPKDPFDRLLAIRRLARNNPNEHEAKAAEAKLAADLEKAGLTERDLDRIAIMRGEGRRPKPVPRPVPQPQVRFVRQPQVQFFFYNSGFGGGYTGYDTGTSTGNGSFTSVTF